MTADSARGPVSRRAIPLQAAGAGLILIAAFVPWVRSHAFFLTIPVNGVQTDYGKIFPFVALAIFGLLAYQWSFGWPKWAPGAIALLAISAMTLALLYGVQVRQRVEKINASAQGQPVPLVLQGGTAFRVEFDIGYYLTLLGCLGVLIGAVLDLKGRQRV